MNLTRFIPAFAIICAAGFLTACDQRAPAWRQYEEFNAAPPSAAEAHAAPRPPPDSFQWTAPAGWESQGRSGMRLATFTVAADGRTGLCTVTRMGAAAANLEANVRRWIGQVGLPEPDETALKSFIDRQRSFQTVGGMPCVLVDLSTLPAAPADGESMLAGFFALEDSTLFAKLTGPRPLVEAQRAVFESFCLSFRREEN